jgi:hypothetical protein
MPCPQASSLHVFVGLFGQKAFFRGADQCKSENWSGLQTGQRPKQWESLQERIMNERL